MESWQPDRDVGEWLVDDITAWVNGFLDTDRLVAIAWRVGATAAELHTSFSGSRRSSVGARTYFVDGTVALDEALAVVSGEVGERLRTLEPAVRAALEPLRTDRLLPAHRVHGDLTVGRFHAVGDELLVDLPEEVDDAPPALPQSPLVDVATLLQSIDHVGRVAVVRAARSAEDRVADDRVNRLTDLLTDAVLQAYGATHAVDPVVLQALRVTAELREYLHAAHRNPGWSWVPDAAMPAVLRSAAR